MQIEERVSDLERAVSDIHKPLALAAFGAVEAEKERTRSVERRTEVLSVLAALCWSAGVGPDIFMRWWDALGTDNPASANPLTNEIIATIRLSSERPAGSA